MNFVRKGDGSPLLLVHGLGGSHRSWDPILSALAARRDTIALDLPGHGDTPPLGHMSFSTLVDSVVAFLTEHGLERVDAVGTSMGARIVLELARRNVVRDVVSLDPGGFWEGWERSYFRVTLGASINLVRAHTSALPFITGNPVTRTLLLLQFSAHPWTLPGAIASQELRSFVSTPSFDVLLSDLSNGAGQEGVASTPGRLMIGWGRQDLVCFSSQAARAQERFPSAEFHWFERCGHFPFWDSPEETTQLILQCTG